MQYLDFHRLGPQGDYPTLAPFNREAPLYSICNSSPHSDALKAYQQFKQHEQLLVNDNPTRTQTLARYMQKDDARDRPIVRLVRDPGEGERVRDLEMRIQAMSDKMQRDKDFFFLVILVIVVAFIITRQNHQEHSIRAAPREPPKPPVQE